MMCESCMICNGLYCFDWVMFLISAWPILIFGAAFVIRAVIHLFKN